MRKKQDAIFKSVKPLPGHKLEVELMTGAYVLLDLTSRLDTLRFNSLEDEDFFNTAYTDGDCIIFGDKKQGIKKIDPETFAELILVDGTGDFPYR